MPSDDRTPDDDIGADAQDVEMRRVARLEGTTWASELREERFDGLMVRCDQAKDRGLKPPYERGEDRNEVWVNIPELSRLTGRALNSVRVLLSRAGFTAVVRASAQRNEFTLYRRKSSGERTQDDEVRRVAGLDTRFWPLELREERFGGLMVRCDQAKDRGLKPPYIRGKDRHTVWVNVKQLANLTNKSPEKVKKKLNQAGFKRVLPVQKSLYGYELWAREGPDSASTGADAAEIIDVVDFTDAGHMTAAHRDHLGLPDLERRDRTLRDQEAANPPATEEHRVVPGASPDATPFNPDQDDETYWDLDDTPYREYPDPHDDADDSWR
jgi:hypothetical protein